MKTRIIVSAILLPIFFAVLFIFSPFVLTLVISLICAAAAFELLCAWGMNYNKRVLVYTIVAATLTPFAVYLSALTAAIPDNPYSTLLLITLLFSILFIIGSLLLIEAVLSIKSGKHTKEINHDNKKQLKFRQIPIALAAGILIPYLLSNLINLKTMPYGHLFVLLPIVAAFLTDSGAYFVGVAIGKKKAFPNISPNKTVEGYVGGIITGTIGMLLYGIILSYTTTLTIIFPALILYGILGAIMTELGDLIFSLIKRKCDIKDFGQIMPGHGGALDRFDSMTLAAPTMYLLATTIPAIII